MTQQRLLRIRTVFELILARDGYWRRGNRPFIRVVSPLWSRKIYFVCTEYSVGAVLYICVRTPSWRDPPQPLRQGGFSSRYLLQGAHEDTLLSWDNKRDRIVKLLGCFNPQIRSTPYKYGSAKGVSNPYKTSGHGQSLCVSNVGSHRLDELTTVCICGKAEKFWRSSASPSSRHN